MSKCMKVVNHVMDCPALLKAIQELNGEQDHLYFGGVSKAFLKVSSSSSTTDLSRAVESASRLKWAELNLDDFFEEQIHEAFGKSAPIECIIWAIEELKYEWTDDLFSFAVLHGRDGQFLDSLLLHGCPWDLGDVVDIAKQSCNTGALQWVLQHSTVEEREPYAELADFVAQSGDVSFVRAAVEMDFTILTESTSDGDSAMEEAMALDDEDEALDMVKYLYSIDTHFSFQYAVTAGRINIMSWYYELHPSDLGDEVAEMKEQAVTNNQRDVVDWFNERGL